MSVLFWFTHVRGDRGQVSVTTSSGGVWGMLLYVTFECVLFM